MANEFQQGKSTWRDAEQLREVGHWLQREETARKVDAEGTPNVPLWLKASPKEVTPQNRTKGTSLGP